MSSPSEEDDEGIPTYVFLLLVLILVAAVAGYYIGTRREESWDPDP